MDALENAGRQPARVYRESTLYTTLSPCPMCSGAILLYGIPRVVIGENRTFMGEEELLRARGVEVTVMDDAACADLMRRFIEERARCLERGHRGREQRRLGRPRHHLHHDGGEVTACGRQDQDMPPHIVEGQALHEVKAGANGVQHAADNQQRQAGRGQGAGQRLYGNHDAPAKRQIKHQAQAFQAAREAHLQDDSGCYAVHTMPASTIPRPPSSTLTTKGV